MDSKGKNAYLFQHQNHMNKMDSEYLEKYVSIYSHAYGLNQGLILWVFDTFAVMAIKNTIW